MTSVNLSISMVRYLRRHLVFTRTRMMVVNALIVWKKLIDICFLIKSSLLALTAAYTKFRRMIGSMIWSCGHRSRSQCVLLPHRYAGRLHWGKAESIQLCDFGDGPSHYRCWSTILHAYHSSDVFTVIRAEVRPSQRINKCGLLYTLTERSFCLLIWQCLMA